MTAIQVAAQTAVAVLYCRKCDARWRSRVFRPERWGDEVRACAPAFAEGWRVFAGERSQLAYCPMHGPSKPMRQVYPPSDDSSTGGERD